MSTTMKQFAPPLVCAAVLALTGVSHAQQVIDVNPVNVPTLPAAPAPTPVALTPMAPSDPHAISHLPKVLVARHNGLNGVAGPAPAPAQVVIPHAPAYPGLTITLQGTVSGDPRTHHFFVNSNGFVYTVRPYDSADMRGVQGGDYVKVFGALDGLIITNANVREISRGTGNSPDSYGVGAHQ